MVDDFISKLFSFPESVKITECSHYSDRNMSCVLNVRAESVGHRENLACQIGARHLVSNDKQVH